MGVVMKIFSYLANRKRARELRAILRREFPKMEIKCSATASDIRVCFFDDRKHKVGFTAGGIITKRRSVEDLSKRISYGLKQFLDEEARRV